MQANQSTTYTRGDLMISSPDEAVVLNVATLALTLGVDSPLVPLTTTPAIGTFCAGQGGVYAGVMRGDDSQPDYHFIGPTDASVLNERLAYGGYEINEGDRSTPPSRIRI